MMRHFVILTPLWLQPSGPHRDGALTCLVDRAGGFQKQAHMFGIRFYPILLMLLSILRTITYIATVL